MADDSPDVTTLLKAWGTGDGDALDRLIPLIYGQLRKLAGAYIRRERGGGLSLDGTALVNEAYLRLVNADAIDWQNRTHFFAVAAKVMRRLLVDAARTRHAAKRGGGWARDAHSTAMDFDALPAADSDRAASLCALDDALEALQRVDPRRASVVELRYFGGLSVEESAAALNVSPQTVMRDWKVARAWLTRELVHRSTA